MRNVTPSGLLTDPVTVAEDGDPVDAAHWQPSIQQLADRTDWYKRMGVKAWAFFNSDGAGNLVTNDSENVGTITINAGNHHIVDVPFIHGFANGLCYVPMGVLTYGGVPDVTLKISSLSGGQASLLARFMDGSGYVDLHTTQCFFYVAFAGRQ